MEKLSTSLTSKTYVVAWDERLEISLEFDRQARGNIDYLVWDRTTTPEPRENWVVAEDVRYFGHFYNSLVDFSKTDHGIFVFNAGDIKYEDFVGFTHKFELLFSEDPDIWLMSPHLPTDWGSGLPTAIQESKIYKNMYLTSHINGLYVIMSRELADMTLSFYEWMLEQGRMDFSRMISGHCLDWVYSAMTIYNNKKIYRDMDTVMYEEFGTSYSTKTALSECNAVRDGYTEWLPAIGLNGGPVHVIYKMMSEKNRHYTQAYVPIDYAYPNLKDASGFKY